MKRMVVALVLALSEVGCGGGACDPADKKLEGCGKDLVFDGGDGSDKNECVANCVMGASCAQIGSGDSTNYYYSCIASC